MMQVACRYTSVPAVIFARPVPVILRDRVFALVGVGVGLSLADAQHCRGTQRRQAVIAHAGIGTQSTAPARLVLRDWSDWSQAGPTVLASLLLHRVALHAGLLIASCACACEGLVGLIAQLLQVLEALAFSW